MAEGWPPTGADEWMALAERTLRGRDLADLTSTTRDGIDIQPLYTEAPARPEAARAAVGPERTQSGWDVRTCHSVVFDVGGGCLVGPGTGGDSEGGLDVVRRRIEDDLAGGATSVELETGAGVSIDELSSVLAGLDLSETPVALAPNASLDTAEALVALASRTAGALAARSSLGLDPLGEWARTGERVEAAPSAEWAKSMVDGLGGEDDRPVMTGESGLDETGAAALSSAGRQAALSAAELGIDGTLAVAGEVSNALGLGVRVFCVDAVRYADAGATEAQALGWATATGVAYLRALVEAGLSVDTAAGLIGFRLPATADQFVTIAALRAARTMWARVVTASGGSQASARQYQHAVTAAHMYSRRDPWVNLLRGAAAALAAGVAGADAVTVLPFDHASGPVDADGALGRQASPQHPVAAVGGVAPGSGGRPCGRVVFYVESLTEQLACRGLEGAARHRGVRRHRGRHRQRSAGRQRSTESWRVPPRGAANPP